jgi:hypothetical protein
MSIANSHCGFASLGARFALSQVLERII